MEKTFEPSRKKDYRVENIMNDFNGFTCGVRGMVLLLRNKDGGKANNPQRTSVKKLISTNKDEFRDNLEILHAIKVNDKRPLRIYTSANPRDFHKAIHTFKQNQLDADYSRDANKQTFYLDIKNRFFSALMKKSSKAGSRFVIDVDHDEGQSLQETTAELVKNNVDIVKEYPTKNGWHIITEPFNPSLCPSLDINTDGLLLIDF